MLPKFLKFLFSMLNKLILDFIFQYPLIWFFYLQFFIHIDQNSAFLDLSQILIFLIFLLVSKCLEKKIKKAYMNIKSLSQMKFFYESAQNLLHLNEFYFHHKNNLYLNFILQNYVLYFILNLIIYLNHYYVINFYCSLVFVVP